MRYLIQGVVILDIRSPFYQKKVDILVENGRIIDIAPIISLTDSQIISGKKLVLSTAFVDMNATSGEPLDLESETLDSFMNAAIAGGFGYVAHVPNERKLTQSKSDIMYLKSRNQLSPCQLLPFGNITKTDNSQVLASLMDMHEAGSAAFFDGNTSSLSLNLIKNALLYSKGFAGKIILHPEKKDLSKNGQVNQGKMSVMLGYKGIPKDAEFMAVQEIANIVDYTESEVLVMNVTTPESIDTIDQANKNRKKIYSAVSSMHILLDETSLVDYDTNYKLNPPLRSLADRNMLRESILTGKIDIVYSQHSPCTPEEKMLEFDLASFGSINLQTSFIATLEALGIENIEKCIEVHSTNPAKYLGIDLEIFDKNTNGSYTIIDLEDDTILTNESNRSKSKNSPFFNRKFQGKIKSVIGNGQITILN